MKRYWILFCGLLVVLLLVFVAAMALEIPLLTDPEPWMAERGCGTAAIGVGLLLADIVLPVPSSFVMMAHGRLFGPVLGTLLSLVGNVGLTMLGYGIGLAGRRRINRFVPDDECARAEAMLGRWGLTALILTRPLPLLAESVAIMAGASRMHPGKVMLAAIVGTLPAAVLYALAGAMASSMASGMLVFVLVVLLAGLSILFTRKKV
jgi:uncharacterized membrane protein YdjX (TVP38/TMEM64 family)